MKSFMLIYKASWIFLYNIYRYRYRERQLVRSKSCTDKPFPKLAILILLGKVPAWLCISHLFFTKHDDVRANLEGSACFVQMHIIKN